MTITRPAGSVLSGFLVKLNGASGMPLWAQSLGGDAGVTRCAAVAANGADVAVACNFEAPVMPYTTVDGMTATLQRQGVVSAFVARLDTATGKARWATAIYATAEAHGLAVLPGGDVFVGGRFGGSLSDAAGSSMLPIAARGDTDAFLMRLAAADGKAKWSTTLAAPGAGYTSVQIWAAAGDALGGLAASGQFFGAPDLGAGTFDAGTADGAFAVSIDPATGKTRWAKAFARSGRATATAIDRWGQVVVGAYYDADDAQLEGKPLPATGPGTESNSVVAKLAADGRLLWSKTLTATSVNDAGRTNCYVPSMATSPGGDVVFGGSGLGEIDFGGDGKVVDPGAFVVRTSP